MLLWMIFAGLTATALIAVLWPVMRSRDARAHVGLTYDAAIFRDQIAEIDAEQENGLLSASEAESARNEVARRLLATQRASSRSKSQGTQSDSGAVAIVLVAAFLMLPVSSSVLYLVYGSPGLPDQPLAARLSKPVEGRDVRTLVAQVEERLRALPQDGRGWEVIAPVYVRLNRYDDAANAYANAIRILGETPQRLSDYGNALVLAGDGVVSETARTVLNRAVALDPQMMRARFWLAIAHEQDGNSEKAIGAWNDILAQSEHDAPWRRAVEQRLAELKGSTGARADAAPKTELRGPSRDEMAAAQSLSEDERAQMIGQMVAGLSERLRSEGGNVDEWKRLIRSYTVMGKPDEAAKALADARTALAENSEAVAELDQLANALGITKAH